MRTRVAAVTGSRADYGLLYWTLRRLSEDRAFDLRLMVTGMHLSRRFGRTVDQIRRDGFRITARVPLPLSSDKGEAVGEAMGAAVRGFARAFARHAPDVVLLLGDRFEIFAAAAAALPQGIPVAHVHGGERTEGAIDDAFRHAITKMSHLHFVSTEEHARRVRQMGEEPWRVRVCGAPGVEYIRRLRPLPTTELQRLVGVTFDRPVHVVTFHPETVRADRTRRDAAEILAALERVPGQLVFTRTNADPGGRTIHEAMMRFLRRRPDARFVANLGQRAYLSLLARATTMIGNSSSGIIEAPSFRLPVVNVGGRQDGRLRASNVVDASCDAKAILAAVGRTSTERFRRSLRRMHNPYDRGNASAVIARSLRRLPARERLLRKQFVDFPADQG